MAVDCKPTAAMFGHMAARLAAAAAAAELGLSLEATEGMVAAAERMGVDFGSYGTACSSQQIIDSHNSMLQHTIQGWSSSQAQVHFSNRMDTKPADEFLQPPPYAAVTPLPVLI